MASDEYENQRYLRGKLSLEERVRQRSEMNAAPWPPPPKLEGDLNPYFSGLTSPKGNLPGSK